MDRLKGAVAQSQALRATEHSLYEIGSAPFGEFDDLEDAIEENPAFADRYEEFCESNSLDTESDIAAGRFLDEMRGLAVLTVNLPADEAAVETAFAETRALAKELKLTVHDPQAGEDIEASYEESLPPGF